MGIVYTEKDNTLGVDTIVHDNGDKIHIEKRYDAQPFLEVAAEARANTDGEKWGEMRHIGFIPPAELATMLRQDGRIDMKRVHKWLRLHPKMVTFNRFLK